MSAVVQGQPLADTVQAVVVFQAAFPAGPVFLSFPAAAAVPTLIRAVPPVDQTVPVVEAQAVHSAVLQELSVVSAVYCTLYIPQYPALFLHSVLL